MAELPAVLAFYHRELAARGWQEDGSAPLAAGDEVAIKISSAEETGVLRLGRKYDFTMVSLTAQVKETALAARAKAKKEADEKFLRTPRCGQAAHRRRRSPAQGAGGRTVRCAAAMRSPTATRRCRCLRTPKSVKFEGADGRLEFNSDLQRQGARRVLSRIAEAGGLEGAALRHQPAQHGGDGVLQGRQVDLDDRDADGAEGECQRQRLGSRDGHGEAAPRPNRAEPTG